MRVLDSSAVIALIQQEPGAKVVERHLESATISLVNYAEIIGYFAKRGLDRPGIHELLDEFPAERIPLDEEQAVQVGLIEPMTRAYGLSLADRACLILARTLDCPAVTGDRQWAKAAPLLSVEVELIR